MQLSHIFIHPLKSAAPLSLGSVDIDPRGPRHDRRWMLVDDEGQFITGRKLGRLVTLGARPTPAGLQLHAPGHAPIRIPEPGPDAPRIEVRVWNDTVHAPLCDEAANRWLAQVLGMPARLVHMDAPAQRPAAGGTGEVSFADSSPVLVLSARAVHDLSQRIGRHMAIERFRPNLVIDGLPAHGEDRWARIRIGGVGFEQVKPCIRCAFTTVDPRTGERDADGEPLRTLAGYRRREQGVSFGVLMRPTGPGRVQLGDRIEVLESTQG